VVILDPVSNIQSAGTTQDSAAMLVRLIDFLRKKKITGLMISLTNAGASSQEMTEVAISSLVDTWLLLRDVETGGERNRLIYVLKSRGMAHSNQVREFLITSKGVKLIEAYLGSEGVFTGSARLSQKNRKEAEEQKEKEELARKKLALEHRRKAMEAQIEALRAEFLAEQEEFSRVATSGERREEQIKKDQKKMAARRGFGVK
jgi:circadian clock protein KaiC